MSRLIRIFSGLILMAAGCATPSIIATQSIQKGDAANNSNKFDEAVHYYKEYLRVSPQLGLYRNPSMEAEVYRKLAHAISTQGKYAQAIAYLDEALKIDEALPDHALQTCEDYRLKGMVEAYSGDFNNAISNLTISLKMNEGMEHSVKEKKRSSIAATYLSLSQISLVLGNIKDAYEYAYQAYALYEGIENEAEGKVESSLILGIVARERNDLKTALRWLNESRELALRKQLSTARQEQALGDLDFLRGDFESGIRHKLTSVEEAERSNIKPQILIAYMRLGDGYRQFGDEKKANQYYRKAMEFQQVMENGSHLEASLNLRSGNLNEAYQYYEKAGSGLGVALVMLRLGENKFQNHDLDSAHIFFQRAVNEFQSMGSPEGRAKASIELAKVNTAMGQYEAAEDLLIEAAKVTIQSDLKWQIHYRYGVIYESKKLYDSAMTRYEKAIDIIDHMRGNLTLEEFKMSFVNAKVEVYDRLIMLLLKHLTQRGAFKGKSAVEKAFEYSEQSRSRTFLDILGNRMIKPKNSIDAGLLEQEQLVRLKLQKLAAEIARQRDGTSNLSVLLSEQKKAQDDYAVVLQSLKSSNPAYSSVMSVEPTSLKAIQAVLDPMTALLEYWISADHLVIWIVTKQKLDYHIISLSQAELTKEVSRCRNAIASQITDVSVESLSKLNKWLIEPVDEIISPLPHLIIIPHLALHFLPFQALQNRQRKFLVENHFITYSPSSSIWYYCLNLNPPDGNKMLALALGDLEIGSHTSLPGTRMELSHLARIYPDLNARSETQFTETFLKNEAANYDHVHMATHGFFNRQQPMYSYLLMSASETDDGMLTLNEIFELNLRCKLVTLSACDTGLGEIGKGDDFVGLSRAFIYAGTPATIVSLWKVDDATTAWLMTRFHQYYISGHSVSEALALAQRDLIHEKVLKSSGQGMVNLEMDKTITEAIQKRKSLTADPYYWAPFVLIGDGSAK